MVAYVIKENIACDPEFSGSIICVCSTEEKKNKALTYLNEKNKNEYISYEVEAIPMDQLLINL